ncbi:MAG: hypothetical protein WC738_04670 [Candidatus Omnitrophota bacterium]|jgi:hypothetical protein
MPYTTTRRSYNMFGKKVARYLTYRRAKKLYNEINRDMTMFEARFIRSKLNHA